MRKQNGRKNLYCLENGMTEKQNNLASLENYCIRRLRRHLLLPEQGQRRTMAFSSFTRGAASLPPRKSSRP